MNTLRRAVVISTILIAGCAPFSSDTQAAASPSLIGAWELISVGAENPNTINIKSWRIEFREQGKWLYSGAMTGRYEGMQLSGFGTWALQKDHLNYTAGANKGQAVAHFEHSFLILSPDPVIRLHGKELVETRYSKAMSR